MEQGFKVSFFRLDFSASRLTFLIRLRVGALNHNVAAVDKYDRPDRRDVLSKCRTGHNTSYVGSGLGARTFRRRGEGTRKATDTQKRES